MLEWRRRYAPSCALFVREVLGATPDQFQLDVMAAYDRRDRRIAVRSGHGVGKTAVLAWMIIHHTLTRYPQRVVATAPTSSQLFDALASEVKGWVGHLPPPLQELLEVKSDRIDYQPAPSKSYVSFRTSRAEQPEALAGVHSENVLLIADEASGVHETIFESAVGSMSGANATTILAGNPVRTSGLFFDAFHKLSDLWTTFHVPCTASSRVTADFIDDVARRYGERSNAYRVRVLGEFPLADDDTAIPFELVEAAMRRDVKPIGVRPVWGVDVARFGSDRTALAKRKGNVLLEPVRSWHALDTMQVVGRIKNEWDTTAPDNRPSHICVDVIGIGAGVVDRLRELKLPVVGVNVSEAPALGDTDLNQRSELWFKGRAWFDQRDVNILADEKLAAELVKVKYKFTPSGKRQIESKKEIKKRGEESPDLADAFLLTFAVDAVTASGAAVGMARTPLRRRLKGLV